MASLDNNQGPATGSTALFVRRPVLAIVLSLLIVVAGIAAIFGAEVRELPQVDSPVITVSTSYSGASPETIDREVTSIIESAAGRVPGVKSISSSSSFGNSRVTVELTESTDLDVAGSDMRDAISRVSRDLPDEVDDPRIVKADSDAQAILRMAVTSQQLSVEELTRLVENQIRDRFTAIKGIADIRVYGDRQQIFRIDVDQSKLATRGLSIADVARALQNVAFDAPAGSLNSDSQALVVRATSEVGTASEIEQLVIRDRTRIMDVASVSLGADTGSSRLRANGKTGIGLAVIRQAGSNTLDISEATHATVAQLSKTLPGDVDIRVTSDDARFINGSITEVLRTLIIAVLIVILVIYLFLLDIRATLIPAITLPVALIGTVAGIWLAGFSINIITLLALVLATGMVVDDAIVVLENIVNRRNDGMGSRAAAVIGTREVFFAVITTTATLAAVFIPLSFLPGKVGGLFREFGFVLAIAVMLSSVVALSLCPMLASRFLDRPASDQHRGNAFTSLLRKFGAAATRVYSSILGFFLRFPLVPIACSALFAVAAWLTFQKVPEELVPPEDRSVALMRVSAPQGVSIEYTSEQLLKIENLLNPLVESGEIENVFSISGRGGRANSAFMVMTLASWEKRARSQQEIVGDINRLVRRVPGVRAFAIQPNSLGIRGAGSGLRMALAGDNYDELAKAGERLVAKMEEDASFGRVSLSYETNQPQLSILIDRERANDIGIPIEGLAAAMQSVLDGREIGKVFVNDRTIDLKLVSTTHPINDPTDLANIFLKAQDGRIVPMSSIATVSEKAVAPSLGREQKQRAINVSASLSESLSLRAGMQKFDALASEFLPEGSRTIPMAEAATLNETSSGLLITFGFAIIVVLLVLAAQFESFVSSFIIMFTVPFGLASAVFALHLTGTSLNVYSQIGLVLLVGIMAKNSILIVDFANQLRDQGHSVREAAQLASTRRLRPVMMTMISTIVGGLPLVMASGAGAEARIALGWVIVGGLGIATVFTLFMTPVFYLLLAGFSKPRSTETTRLNEELAAV